MEPYFNFHSGGLGPVRGRVAPCALADRIALYMGHVNQDQFNMKLTVT